MDASSGNEHWEKEIKGDRQAGIAGRQTGSFLFLSLPISLTDCTSTPLLPTLFHILVSPSSHSHLSISLSVVNHPSLPQPQLSSCAEEVEWMSKYLAAISSAGVAF